MSIKLSDYVWQYIAGLNVGHVFMFPGGGAMHLVDSIGNNESLEYVTLLHEQACAFAAETYSRISNNFGVVLVTTGPGGTNAVTGCAAAWLESTPMIFISGQAKTEDLKGDTGVRQRGNQEIGIVDIVSSITKYSITILKASEIKYHLDKAVYMAKSGRPGPVWIDIPLDIQAAMIDEENLAGYVSTIEKKGILRSKDVEEVAGLLQEAKRPIIIAGQGIERNNGKEAFRELVEYLKVPVLTSWLAVELLEYNHPYNFGKPGMVAARYSNFAMQESDLVIAIGTRLDPAMIGYNPEDFAPNAKKVIVDIDPAELNKFQFCIEKKICADATEFVRELSKALKRDLLDLDCNKWVQQCQKWKAQYPLLLEEFKMGLDYVNPYFFFDQLSDVLAEDDVIIPGSSGATIDVFWLCIKNKRSQRMLATGSLGSMGYGLPASMGACYASGKRTICIEGDGSFQLNIQELADIKGENLPIKIFVMNNNGYLSITNMQRAHFHGHYVGSNAEGKLHIPDIVNVAKGYGIPTYEISSHKDLSIKLNEVLSVEGPVICNVVMKDELLIQPKVMSRVRADGSMESGSLSNLWPFLDDEE